MMMLCVDPGCSSGSGQVKKSLVVGAKFLGDCVVLYVEARVLKWSLCQAERAGYFKVIVDGNSLLVIKCVHGECAVS